ncbi:MAG: glycosyltransferase family 2 protein [Trueperaceae bacterium]|nr:glycosyltransferase family 2 protein [Trueperaceae bacterium]
MTPSVTIILTSHMKPYLREALESVQRQTYRDFECVVVDSGVWIGKTDERSRAMAAIHADFLDTVTWFSTDEPDDLRGSKCPVSYATNLALRKGLVRGEYVCHFYDDDEYEPEFIEKMAGFLDDHPDANAVWCTQDRLRILQSGESQLSGQIVADRELTPGSIDCRVDGGQIMYRRHLLDAMGDPWMDEDAKSCHHSDGIFLERLATLAGPIPPLNEKLYTHRFTPISTYSPT